MKTEKGPVRVEIPFHKFWSLARMQPIHMNISVLKTLRNAGVPVDGGIELRGVTHGRLTCWNDTDLDGNRVCIYEWEPIPGEPFPMVERDPFETETPKPATTVVDDDDEL